VAIRRQMVNYARHAALSLRLLITYIFVAFVFSVDFVPTLSTKVISHLRHQSLATYDRARIIRKPDNRHCTLVVFTAY
jgi:hypothetical protein